MSHIKKYNHMAYLKKLPYRITAKQLLSLTILKNNHNSINSHTRKGLKDKS
jgi:hypothetical protein